MAAVNGSERCVEYTLEAHPESLNAVDKHQVTERSSQDKGVPPLIMWALLICLVIFYFILYPEHGSESGRHHWSRVSRVLSAVRERTRNPVEQV